MGREADVHGIIDEFSLTLAAVISSQCEARSFATCHDAVRAAVHAVLGIVRHAAQHEPERRRAPDMKARLIAVVRAALAGLAQTGISP